MTEPDSNTIDAPLDSDVWRPFEDVGFISLTGPIYYHSTDKMRFCLVPDERHRNLNDTVHGGMLMTLADRAFGTVGRQATGSRVVTIQMDTCFMKAAELGAPIVVTCRVIRKTRSLIFIDGDMVQSGEIVVTVRGVFKILS